MDKNRKLFYDLFESPIGPLWMVSVKEGLSYLLWHRSEAGMRTELHRRLGRRPERNSRHSAKPRRFLKRYFSGEAVAFEEAIVFLEGTPFQHAVWRKLLAIPYGKVLSYGSLCEQLNRPGAARAIGKACGRNPLPVAVPCHRVVRSDGRLGGYTGGIDIKTHLLKIEGVL